MVAFGYISPCKKLIMEMGEEYVQSSRGKIRNGLSQAHVLVLGEL
jgi:hypothetical protein